jgi:hypothetical protein
MQPGFLFTDNLLSAMCWLFTIWVFWNHSHLHTFNTNFNSWSLGWIFVWFPKLAGRWSLVLVLAAIFTARYWRRLIGCYAIMGSAGCCRGLSLSDSGNGGPIVIPELSPPCGHLREPKW